MSDKQDQVQMVEAAIEDRAPDGGGKKVLGRYARMVAFWSVTLLIAYGCFHGGGLVTVLDKSILPETVNQPLIQQFPLLGTLKASTLIACALVALVAFAVHRMMARPKIADALVQTESEMAKVTWPTWSETWAGTMAVAVTVVVLFVFLTLIDMGLAAVLARLMGSP